MNNARWRTVAAGAENVIFGATTNPTLPGIAGDTYIRTSNGTSTGAVKEEWIFDGASWVLAWPYKTTSLTPQVFQSGSYINAIANSAANSASLMLLSNGQRADSAKVLWPGHPFTIGAFYYLSQTVAGTYTTVAPTSGFVQPLFYVEDAETIHIDIERPTQAADFFRDTTVSKALPDGTLDTTEGIVHAGAIHIGRGTTSPAEGFTHEGVLSVAANGNFNVQTITTAIPKDSTIMPRIDLRGYVYGTADSIDVSMALYSYSIPSGSIINTYWQSNGSKSPVQIRMGWNASNTLDIEITWPIAEYFNRYEVSVYCDGNSAQQATWFQGWTYVNAVLPGTDTQIVTVARKWISNGADVFRTTQALVAGNNVITHNLGFAPVVVDVRNASNGSTITARVVAETTTTTTIFVPVAVASARISIDA